MVQAGKIMDQPTGEQGAEAFPYNNDWYSVFDVLVSPHAGKGVDLIGFYFGNYPLGLLQVREVQNMSQNSSRGSHQSAFGRHGQITALPEELPGGHVKVGKISFHPDQLLGKGCEGTFVYR